MQYYFDNLNSFKYKIKKLYPSNLVFHFRKNIKTILPIFSLLLLLSFTYFIFLSIRNRTSYKIKARTDFNYTCPLNTQDITGVQQWNDGWPFSAYGRNSHTDSNYKVVDVNAFYGSPVYAPADGVIIDVYTDPPSPLSYGVDVVIWGNDGSIYEMAHVFDPVVNTGNTVLSGSLIGHLVTLDQAQAQGRLCDLSQEFTTLECYKAHLHFTVYNGTYGQPMGNPTEGLTLGFLSSRCGIKRPAGDYNIEFPQLPTLNCAKITGNPNIRRCFLSRQTPTPTSTPTPSPTPTPPPANLTLKIKLQNITVKRPNTFVTVNITKASGVSVLSNTYAFTADVNGIYSTTINGLPLGTFNIKLKPQTFLAKKFTGQNLTAGNMTLDFTAAPFLGGDTVGENNIVDIFDYNRVVSDFGPKMPAAGSPADINKDGKVDIFDYNVIVQNFNKRGAS